MKRVERSERALRRTLVAVAIAAAPLAMACGGTAASQGDVVDPGVVTTSWTADDDAHLEGLDAQNTEDARDSEDAEDSDTEPERVPR